MHGVSRRSLAQLDCVFLLQSPVTHAFISKRKLTGRGAYNETAFSIFSDRQEKALPFCYADHNTSLFFLFCQGKEARKRVMGSQVLADQEEIATNSSQRAD
jgi:hypothetical protein